MRDLAPTSGTQVYEAWLIVGTDAPIPIGSFTVGTTRTATFATNHVPFQGVTVALTREPGPNATTPTLPIIALGAARTAS
jgi:anti-sigma-K factor RskA